MNNITFKEKLEYFLKDIYYIIPVIITALLSFGFVVTHHSVNIDTLAGDRYFEKGALLLQGRFGSVFINKVLNILEYNPFFVDTLAVILLIGTAITLCLIFRKISNDKLNKVVYTIFSCLFISYPLISEIFVYTPASLSIALNYFLVVISICLILKYFENKKKINMFLATTLLSIAVGSYESFVSVYLCLIFFVLILSILYENKKRSQKEIIKQFFIYLIPIILSIFISKSIAWILVKMLNFTDLKYAGYAANGIISFEDGIIIAIKRLIQSIFYNYGLKGLFYLPIAVIFVFTVIHGIINITYFIKKKDLLVFVLFLGMWLTLFAIPVLQGQASPYRTCQVFAIFVSCTSVLFLQKIIDSNINDIFKKCIIVFMFLLVFYQVKDLHHWFYLNYLRYENEKTTLTTIANELQKNYDINKPVIFIGSYTLPDYIENSIRIDKSDFRYKLIERYAEIVGNKDFKNNKIVDNSVNSYINWGLFAFEETNTEIFKWLEMLGYNFKQGDVKQLKEDIMVYLKMDSYPSGKYILENENVIVVKLK